MSPPYCRRRVHSELVLSVKAGLKPFRFGNLLPIPQGLMHNDGMMKKEQIEAAFRSAVLIIGLTLAATLWLVNQLLWLLDLSSVPGNANQTVVTLARVIRDVPWWVFAILTVVFSGLLIFSNMKTFAILNDHKSESERLSEIERHLAFISSEHESLKVAQEEIRTKGNELQQMQYNVYSTLENVSSSVFVDRLADQAKRNLEGDVPRMVNEAFNNFPHLLRDQVDAILKERFPSSDGGG